MSIIDGVKNVFKFNDDYDYEDDEDYGYDYEDDDYDDKSYSRKKLFQGNKKYDDDDEEDRGRSKSKVVPIKTGGHRGLEVVVIRPESMEDASEITDTLLTGKAVVLNLEGIHVEIAQRIIDYSAGSCYAMRGNLQKITNYIFLVTPTNVDISGDLQDLLGTSFDSSSMGSRF